MTDWRMVFLPEQPSESFATDGKGHFVPLSPTPVDPQFAEVQKWADDATDWFRKTIAPAMRSAA